MKKAKVKTKGIILSETNYSESSKILSIFTSDYGIIGVISKGCRNYKSKLNSVSLKLTYAYFYINYNDSGLSTLLEADIIDDLKNIKTNLEKIGYVSFLLDLAKQVENQSLESGIFNELEKAIVKINNGFDPMIITNIVELKYLYFLGVAPIVDRCAKCGSTKNIVTINADAGGYLCKDCYKDEYITDEKTVKLIRMFEYVDISKISELAIKDKNKIEINKFLEDYYTKYTGLYLKSKNFLDKIREN